MTREEAIADIRDNIKPVVGGISLDMAIKALEQQPCEDCISREVVHGFIRNLPKWCVKSEDGKFSNVGLLYDDVMFGIDKLPPVTSLKSIDGLLDDIYNMADASIVYGHLVNFVFGRKDIEETVNAITDAYRKIVLNVIKKYCEVGDTDGEDSN